MFSQFLFHTPYWVWALLAALIWLGVKQALARRVSLRRVTMLPAAMLVFSLYGTISAFGVAPQVLLVWLLACAGTTALLLQRALPPDAHYDHASQQFSLPGSWVPLLLMMALFVVKYIVRATRAIQLHHGPGQRIQPALAHFMVSSAASLAGAGRLLRLVGHGNPLPGIIVLGSSDLP